jgi:hypothetical protein
LGVFQGCFMAFLLDSFIVTLLAIIKIRHGT